MEKAYFSGVHIHSKRVPGNPANLINLNVYWLCKSTCACVRTHTHTHTHTHTQKQCQLISYAYILFC